MSEKFESDPRHRQNQRDDDAAGDLAELRRLRWRARRGVLELDLLFQSFLDSHPLGKSEARAFARLLEKDDDELLRLLIYNAAREEDGERNDLLNWIKQKRNKR